MIEKVLCGLRTSGARFHAKFADALCALGFTPNVWIHDAGDVYEYVVVYVDDILTALKVTRVRVWKSRVIRRVKDVTR